MTEKLERADERARSRLRALRLAEEFARKRQLLCEAHATAYETSHPDDNYWSRSERCAAQEARYIADEIARLIKEYGQVR